MFRAFFQTSNFTFDAFGQTKAQARKALELGLKRHADQYRMSAFQLSDLLKSLDQDIYCHEITAGTCLRDRELL